MDHMDKAAVEALQALADGILIVGKSLQTLAAIARHNLNEEEEDDRAEP